MARLVVHPGTPKAWEIELRPGVNSLGRTRGNDFQIPDPSVSGSHCQILVNDGAIVLKDVGSSNGSFVNGIPVQEKALQDGESIHLGTVEMLFLAGSPQPAMPVTSRPGIRKPTTAALQTESAGSVITSAALSATDATQDAVGGQSCKFHPKTPGRFFCETCQQFYCDWCVASHGRGDKTCRHCGAPCLPVQVHYQPTVEKGLFERLPGAFAYPIRGAGIFVVVVGIVVLAMLKGGHVLIKVGTLRTMLFGAVLAIAAGGYLFTYLQCLLLSTVAEDRELPELPGIGNFIEDLLVPFGRLAALGLCCFGPALLALIWVAVSHQPAFRWVVLAATLFGFLYFPMALLAVGILDTLPAANPLVVVPSILKAPMEYAVALLFLAITIAFRFFGGMLLDRIFPDGWTTQSIPEFLATLGSVAFVSFTTLYLLVVSVHVLGLLYVCRKHDLAWLAH